ncbi:MAG: galactitol-1-phosphate 5-dehydrogenase [Lachnospiraceae bacterium]|jgi:L-iditol 2-dehydrogenase|nr:galactitol-1-phosphate 5-dehydrogenase [Lachnospiraceae bacterium]
MKAYVLHGAGDLRYETVADPVPGKKEVLVAVKHVGICGSDLPRIYQTGAHVHPLVPGHEFAGTVVDVGDEAGKGWLGKRVGVFPMIPCRACAPCLEGHYELCRSYGYLGSRRDGGFAEFVAVPEENLLLLPDDVSLQEAAMLEPMSVAVHAMRRGLPEWAFPPGENTGRGQADVRGEAAGREKTIVVCGLGTIGMFLLMFLKEAGYENVFALGNKEFQREKAALLGVPDQDYCDVKTTDAGRWLSRRTEGRGTNVSFECVGKNETVSLAVECAAPEGRIVLVGNPASDMAFKRDIYWKILRNQLTVTGTWNSSFNHEAADDWHYVLERLGGKRIDPAAMISHRLPLAFLERGLHIMRDKTEDYGKIMADI